MSKNSAMDANYVTAGFNSKLFEYICLLLIMQFYKFLL